MTVNTSAAYGIYPHDIALPEVMHTLGQSGFDKEDICMMLSPGHPMAATVREASMFTAERESSSKLMRWIFEFGAVVIPTVGFFIRSQAFFHALLAVKDSPMCGGPQTLEGLGFSKTNADRFERQFREVGVLIYVACPESSRAAWAVEVLRQTGARDSAMLEQAAAAAA